MTHPPSPSETPPIRLVFMALILVVLLASLDQTIVSTALPTIMDEFGGLAHLSWIVTAYLLTTTLVGPLYGKLGDLFGRKIILQVAIVIFLAGSALCGLSRTLLELILFRALQGLGGGGLMVTAMATVGDFVAPRDRGHYQGIFGAVFALSTVLGPLIGGFFVDHFSWRWIFYVNLPIGIASLLVISAVFPRAARQTGPRPPIDYIGIVMLTLVLTTVVLMTSLGGADAFTGIFQIVALAAVGILSLAGFIMAERRAREPLLPLALFRNRIFLIACLVGFIVGVALFGSITLMPVYLQMVKGIDPTSAGLYLTPMMAGVVVTSVASGRMISRTGRYRIFPILGTGIMTLALFAVSTLQIDTPPLMASLYMFFLGLGLGMVMQNLVMAVQNATAYKNLGVATSGTILFRSIGGLAGVSLFGAIFASGLRAHLMQTLPAEAERLMAADHAVLATLSPSAQLAYEAALTAALHPVFWTATGLAACGFLMALALKDIPLRKTAGEGLAQLLPIPRETTSLQELEHIIMTLMEHENRWKVYDRVTAEAQVEVAPEELWLLARLMEHAEGPSAEALAGDLHLDLDYVRMVAERLVHLHLAAFDQEKRLHPTVHGRQIFARVAAAWSEHLEHLLAAWAPERHPEVKAMLDRLAKSLAAAPPLFPKDSRTA